VSLGETTQKKLLAASYIHKGQQHVATRRPKKKAKKAKKKTRGEKELEALLAAVRVIAPPKARGWAGLAMQHPKLKEGLDTIRERMDEYEEAVK
jgi:hypothetical protein